MVKVVKKEPKEELKEKETAVRAEEQTVEKYAASEGEVSLAERLQQKEKEAAEYYDKYLRAVADLENYKKRAVREKNEAIKFGQENLIRDIIPLLDGLDRALDQAEKSSDFESFKRGLELLRSQLMGCLERHGVQAIDCTQQAFDPNFHEAMMQVDSDRHEDNQIVDELEKGYMLNGRLLRPAKVSVCKRRKGSDTCISE
ncbi:MAG: nucleotide exchange factor GrpE [Syntrophales bacterium]|nr:nucleotide exchange factor GrpE [Syntrophales bacterium]